MTANFSLEQLVTFPTRGNNTLDLFFTNNSSLVDSISALPGISDHEIVHVLANLSPHRSQKPPRKIYQFHKTNEEGMASHLTDLRDKITTMFTNKASTDQLWTTFRQGLEQAMHQFVPTKTWKPRSGLPWISKKIKSLIRKKEQLFRKMRQTNSPQDSRKFKEIRHKCQSEIRKAYHSFIDGIIDPDPKQPQKRFWSFIKSLRRDNMGIAPLKDGDGVASTASDKAEILNNQFSSVFTSEPPGDLPDIDGPDQPTMPDINISTNGILKLLNSLNPHKAQGPDGIPPRILKDHAPLIAPMLQCVFQRSIDEGQVPADWLRANVAPIFKKGNRSAAANYRPVSLTCICSKLMEHVLASSMMTHLDSHNILYEWQHGFRSRRSCETQLVTFLHHLAQNMDRGRQTDVVIMDFSKAFDKVPHRRLMKKLCHYGIRGSAHRWINSFLHGRSQRVVVDGNASRSAPVLSGVPQGTVLGPILFLIYINDLPSRLKSDCRLFADDCILYRQISSKTDSDTLQSDLDRLTDWEAKWLMTFNPDKCFSMTISKSRSPTRTTYSLRGHPLDIVDTAKYLGVTIDSKLRWKPHINIITNRANNILGLLKRNLRNAPTPVKEKAYNTLVRPHLEYCSSVWDPHQQYLSRKVEMVQRRAARFTLNRYHNTSSVTNMLDQLNWTTLAQRRVVSRLCLVHKISHCLVAIPSLPYLPPLQYASRHCHRFSYTRYSPKSDVFKYSFFPSTIVQWNALPEVLVVLPTADAFRAALQSYYETARPLLY